MLDVPQFAVKSRDVVGLHISQPAHAAVLRIDENSQIQALDRTQPGTRNDLRNCGR
jgi:hypothetical protein